MFPRPNPLPGPGAFLTNDPLGLKGRLPGEPLGVVEFLAVETPGEEAVRILENWSDFPGRRLWRQTQNPPENLTSGLSWGRRQAGGFRGPGEELAHPHEL